MIFYGVITSSDGEWDLDGYFELLPFGIPALTSLATFFTKLCLSITTSFYKVVYSTWQTSLLFSDICCSKMSMICCLLSNSFLGEKTSGPKNCVLGTCFTL